MPIVLPSIEVADAFTVRSKRSVLANRAPSASLGMESDSCHKVRVVCLVPSDAISISEDQDDFAGVVLEWVVYW